MIKPKIKVLLAENPKLQAMFPSTVGQVLTMLTMLAEINADETKHDLRDFVETRVCEILESVRPDRASWPYVKTQMTYSEYLRTRRDNGTISEYDLIRPGMIEAQFDSPQDYFDHYGRVLEAEKRLQELGLTGMKTCSRCGSKKPEAAFRRGAVCNSCRSRNYRSKAAVATEEEEAM